MKSDAWLGLFAFGTSVAAHGQVIGVVAGGISYPGYVPQYQYLNPRPKVAGWSISHASKNGPVYPASYNNPDIICHEAATPAAASITVTAGSTIELQWSPWPLTHHGPVIDYLANCDGPCSSVDKTKLEFNKIDATGLLRQSTAAGQAGYWAADKLRDTNNSWTVTIPSTIAPGGYVLRHEIIALHSARILNGAQNYPHCINLEVTGTGTDSLAQGTLGTELYKETDPGIQIDIYKPLDYTMPGPALYSRRGSAVTLPSGNSTSAYQSSVPVAAKAKASPAEHRVAPQMAESVLTIAALNTSSRATNLTSTPHIQFPHSDTSPPKIAKAHKSADSLFGPAAKPSAANSPPALPDLSSSSTPLPSTGLSHTSPSSSSSTTPPPTSSTTAAPSSTKSISKPCTRRIRITKSSAAPFSSSTPPPSSTIPPQSQNQAISSTPPSTPSTALPTEQPLPSLDGMSVQQLLRWLKAVVGALDGKLHGGGKGKREYVRDVGGL